MSAMQKVRIIEGLTAASLPIDELIEAQEPAILKGVAADWPLVRKGEEGAGGRIQPRPLSRKTASRAHLALLTAP